MTTPRIAPNRRSHHVLVAGVGLLLVLYAAGWMAMAIVFWQRATFYVPRVQSAVAIALALLVLRAAAATRRSRRLVVISVLVLAGVAFVVLPLPQWFQGHGLMADGTQRTGSRQLFEERFEIRRGSQAAVNFHSHLSDVLMARLDTVFGRTEHSPQQAFDVFSRLMGLLFLIELGIVGAWHRWSRRICRYVGLALATPLCLLYFGYWELGYASVAAGVFPLLVMARGRKFFQSDAATLFAGAVQGLHTAGHGYGMLGLAGGALALLGGRGDPRHRVLRSATFASSAVAWYLGWIFLYVTVAGLSIHWDRHVNARPIFEQRVFDTRIAEPLLSLSGLAELGLWSAFAGVPLLALATLTSRGAVLVQAVLYGLPGLIFLVRWFPERAPYNLDQLLVVFPGVFGACWVLASSRLKAVSALATLVVIHGLLWTSLGSAMFDRVWVESIR